MLPLFVRRNLAPLVGGDVAAWLAAQRLRRARVRRWKQLRRRHRRRRLARATTAALATFLAALIVGHFAGGIGDAGVLATYVAAATAFVLLSIFPRWRSATLHDLRAASLAELAGTAEAWLEMQRPRLSAPAQAQLDRLGLAIEHLSPRMRELDPATPAAQEIRGLLGEHMPALIESYLAVPEPHRNRPGATGASPEEHLSNGLAIIAREIDTLSEQIGRGGRDALAIRGRYLETRYSGAGEFEGD